MSISRLGDKLEEIGKQDFNKLFSKLVNKRTDNLVLSGEVSQSTFEEFEQIAFQNYSSNNDLRIYAHEDYREQINGSNKLNEDAIEFFELNYSSSNAADILGDSKLGDRTIFVTDRQYKEELRSWIENKQDVITIYE